MTGPSGERELALLLDAARSGDAEAWRRLVRSQADRLYGIAWRVSGDRGLAEDAVQQTFLRLFEGRSPPRSASALRTWLARVATRCSIDAVRSRSSRRQRERERAMNPIENRDGRSGPEEAAITNEQHALVASALEVLPADMRAALWLQVVEGVGVREIAETLASSRSSISRLIRDGRARVKSFLERHRAVALLPGVDGVLRQLANPPAPAALLARLERIPTSAPTGSGAPSATESLGAGAASGLLARVLVSAVAAGSIVGLATYLAFHSAGDGDGGPGLDPGEGLLAGAPAEVGEPGTRSLPAGGDPTAAGVRDGAPNAGVASPARGTYRTSVSGVATVTDTEEPVPSAQVDLIPTGRGPRSPVLDFAPEPAQTASTDGLGGFRFESVPAGTYRVRVRSRLGLGMLWPIDIRRGDAPAAGLRVEVHRLERGMGRIVLPDGRPLPADPEVFFANARDGLQPVFDLQRARVAPDGRVLLDVLDRDRFSDEQLFAFVSGYFVSRIETGGFPDRPLQIHFETGRRASGRVIGLEGDPVRGMNIAAYTLRHREQMPGFLLLTFVEEVTTDGEGRFSLASLPPGEIALKAASGQYLSRDLLTFETGERDVQLEPIRVPASRLIRGRVRASGPGSFARHVYIASVDRLNGMRGEGPRQFVRDPHRLAWASSAFLRVSVGSGGSFESPPLLEDESFLVTADRGALLAGARGEEIVEAAPDRLVVRPGGEPLELVAVVGSAAVSGSVFLAKGRPLPFAQVTLSARKDGGSTSQRAIADQQGRFSFDVLPTTDEADDDVMIVVSAEEGGRKGEVVLGSPAEARSRGEVELVVSAVQGLAIRGKVTDSGSNPVSRVRVQASATPESPDWGTPRSAETSREGSFHLAGVDPDSEYVLTFRSPGSATERRGGVRAGDTVAIRLQPEAVAIARVVKPDGEPVENAAFSARRVDTKGGYAPFRVESLGNGSYRLSQLAAGEYVFAPSIPMAGGQWGCIDSEPVILRAGQVVRDLRLVLSPKVSLTGRILERKSGEPIEGASISRRAPSSGDDAGSPAGLARRLLCPEPTQEPEPVAISDALGRFELGGFPAGRFRIHVWADGYEAEDSSVTFNGRSDEETEIYLRSVPTAAGDPAVKGGASIVGVVRDARGRAVEGASVSYSFEEAPNHWVSSAGSQVETDARGAFEIPELVAGRYTLDVPPGEHSRRWKSTALDLESGERRSVDIQLEALSLRDVVLRGVVVDQDDRPVPAVLVHLHGAYHVDERDRHVWLEEGPRSGLVQAATDASGAFELAARFEDRRIDLLAVSATVQSPDFVYNLETDQIPFDGSMARIVLTRRAKGKARIRFEKADGTPAANAAYYYHSEDGKGGSGSRLKDPTGLLELDIAEGSYVMHGATGNCLDSQTRFEVRGGDVVEVTVKPASPGRLEGMVVDREGVPLVEAVIRIANWHGFVPCPWLEPVTDEAGRFEIELPPGRFTFFINRSFKRGPYEIRSGETTRARIEVKSRR